MEFEIEFDELKYLAEKDKKTLTAVQHSSEAEPPPLAPSACTPHTTTSSLTQPTPHIPYSPPTSHSPRTAMSVPRIHECLSLLEMEFMDCKESKLQDSGTILQVQEEIQQLKE